MAWGSLEAGLLGTSNWEDTLGRPELAEGILYVSHVARDRLGRSWKALLGREDVWNSLLRLLPLRPHPGQTEDNGWMDGFIFVKLSNREKQFKYLRLFLASNWTESIFTYSVLHLLIFTHKLNLSFYTLCVLLED